MTLNKTYGYALFNNNEFSAILYYPSEGTEEFSRITAALKSNPTINVDENNDISTTNKYSIIVEGEHVGSLNILKIAVNDYDLNPLHNSLKNNPTVVWINSEIPPKINTKWSYDGTNLTLVEN